MSSDDVLVSCTDAALTFGRGAQAVVAVHGADLKIRAGGGSRWSVRRDRARARCSI